MSEQYNTEVAKHYSAYRPPLHGLILERLLRSRECFRTGLDIGCGTGRSTVALANYCERVFGLDSNKPMISEAENHPNITYVCGRGDALDLIPIQTFDVITFAGSLFYLKTDKLRNELARVCDSGAVVLVYDFEVLLQDILSEIGVNCPSVSSGYDHSVNISDWSEFSTETINADRVELALSEEELAHVLFSNSNRFEAFMDRFPNGDSFESLVAYFKSKETKHPLQANIHYARFHRI